MAPPPQTNIEPEKRPVEDHFPLHQWCWVSMLICRGVVNGWWWLVKGLFKNRANSLFTDCYRLLGHTQGFRLFIPFTLVQQEVLFHSSGRPEAPNQRHHLGGDLSFPQTDGDMEHRGKSSPREQPKPKDIKWTHVETAAWFQTQGSQLTGTNANNFRANDRQVISLSFFSIYDHYTDHTKTHRPTNRTPTSRNQMDHEANLASAGFKTQVYTNI